VQVGLADVLIDAVNAALQDREVVFRLGPIYECDLEVRG